MLNSLSVWHSPVRYIRGGFSTSDGLLYTLTSGRGTEALTNSNEHEPHCW
jgi:hypothetical protein